MNEFSDFSDEKILVGTKKPISDLIGKHVIVKNFKFIKTKYSSNCAQVQFQFEEGGELFVFFTASEVLTKQLINAKDKLPFGATIMRLPTKSGNNYYTFA